MDFTLTEEQLQLQASVSRFVTQECDVARHRRLSNSETGYDRLAWQQFADLGWLGIPFAEAQGGIGGSAADVMVVCEALGAGLSREPFLSTVVTCGALLRHGADADQQAAYIPSIIDGSRQWAFAFAEAGSGYDMARVACAATSSKIGFSLKGSKIAVLNGHNADYLVLTARTRGEMSDELGVTLFVVDTTLPGVTLAPFTAMDGSKGANLELDHVQVSHSCMLGIPGKGLQTVALAVDDSIAAMGAEALGAMQALLDATVNYTRTREQFGQPIGKFQALQHRMADMYLKVEETRSLVYNAVIRLDEGDPGSALASAALKVKMAEAGRYVSQQAVQLHGGIGMTDELMVGHHFKRLLLLSKLYGDEEHFLQRYLALASNSSESAIA